MDNLLKQALLYDFYGELLTSHQKEVDELYIVHDLSLSEIAAEKGISRQGVHDLIKRCTKSLLSYEETLHLVEKFVKVKEKVKEIEDIAEHASKKDEGYNKIKQITDEIIREL